MIARRRSLGDGNAGRALGVALIGHRCPSVRLTRRLTNFLGLRLPGYVRDDRATREAGGICSILTGTSGRLPTTSPVEARLPAISTLPLAGTSPVQINRPRG